MVGSATIFGVVILELTLAALGLIDSKVGDRVVSLPEFLHLAWSGLLPSLWLGPVAFALWKQRRWGRHAAVGFWVILVVGVGISAPWGNTTVMDALVFAFQSLILVGGSAWYFFRSKRMVAYYGSLPVA